MAFLTSGSEIDKLNKASEEEALLWQEDYPEFQRLADNGLMSDLDESLPEVNDGSLSASLFKLPKRIVNSKLTGRVKTTDRDDAWVTELANIVWEDTIVKNANSQAPFHRKWKDAVRKAAIFGSVPLITLFVERGKYTGADFIVGNPADVRLAPGAVSDYDSDIIFWDVFYSKTKLAGLIEQAKEERKETQDGDGYNKWTVSKLQKLYDEYDHNEEDAKNQNKRQDGNKPQPKGVKFTIVFQRGVNAPFYMMHGKTKVREWSNPDPSGDVPVHFLYCYQDFVNPYGIGICKLAGGTQNLLDYMRQADVLATQLGLRPPVEIRGTDLTGLDRDSLVYAQDAQWELGNADVKRQNFGNEVYAQLPQRQSMYKTSLNQLIPVGDTSIASGSGDPQYSKTPAGVKFQESSLSIDDEDFKDNLYMTYEAKARSLLNTHFANMQGTDIIKVNDENRDILTKAGLEFPVDELGEPTNELEIIWDNARAEFEFELDPEDDKTKDDEKRLEGLMKVAEFRASDPTLEQRLLESGKKLNVGELFSSIIHLTTDNNKIIEDVSPEEMQQRAAGVVNEQMDNTATAQPQQDSDYVQKVMEYYGVDEPDAMAMVEAESLGYSRDEILNVLQQMRGQNA